MVKKMVSVAFMLLAGLSVCIAGKIDGKWKTTMGGDMELTFTFKVVSDTLLTGSVSSQMGDIALKNGKVKGDQFTFDVDMDGNIISHICKLEGEVIRMTIKMPADMGGGGDGPGEMILKRVEEK